MRTSDRENAKQTRIKGGFSVNFTGIAWTRLLTRAGNCSVVKGVRDTHLTSGQRAALRAKLRDLGCCWTFSLRVSAKWPSEIHQGGPISPVYRELLTIVNVEILNL